MFIHPIHNSLHLLIPNSQSFPPPPPPPPSKTSFRLSYHCLFQPVLLMCFSLPPDEIPGISQSFSGYFSLGNNDDTAQAGQHQNSGLVTHMKSSSLPLLAGLEVCDGRVDTSSSFPTSSPCLILQSLSGVGSGELRGRGISGP